MKEYIYKYRSHIILMGLFVFLVHGIKLNSAVIGIDTEDIIHLQNQFYGGWLHTGRQGLVFLKWITRSMEFHPFMAGLMTLLIYALAVSAFLLLWDTCLGIKGKNMWAWAVCGLLWIAHPVMTEQLYFTLQSAEICAGIFLTAFILYLLSVFGGDGASGKKSIWKYIAAVPLLVLLFSIYQAFVPFFIFGVTTVLFLNGLNRLEKDRNVGALELFRPLAPYVVVFFIAFLVNTVITRLFFSTSDYLSGQVLWGRYPVIDNLRAIYQHIIAVFTGRGDVHYSFAYGLLGIAAFLGIILLLLRSRQGKMGAKIVLLFYFFAMCGTPFWMTLLCGGFPVVRSQLILPAMTGFLGYLDIWLAGCCGKRIKTIALWLVGMICFLGIWTEVDVTLSFHYTEEMCYEQDAALGRAVSYELERVMEGEDLPVVFVGSRAFRGNNATLVGEIIGHSFFDHDASVEPAYYWSSRRILGFLHTLGTDFRLVDKGQMDKAVRLGQNMDVWPAQGSVLKCEDMVIVKLGE